MVRIPSATLTTPGVGGYLLIIGNGRQGMALAAVKCGLWCGIGNPHPLHERIGTVRLHEYHAEALQKPWLIPALIARNARTSPDQDSDGARDRGWGHGMP